MTKSIVNSVPTLKQQHERDLRKVRAEERKAKEAAKPKPKKRGRPRKAVVESKKKRGQVGRPKGEAGIMNDYKARMLASPKSERVIESIYNAALNDEHKHQAAAWKMIIDRVLPVSMFEKEVSSGGGKPTVNITIGTVGDVKMESSIDEADSYIDGDIVDNDA